MNLKTLNVAPYLELIRQKGEEHKKTVIVKGEKDSILIECEGYLLEAKLSPEIGWVFNAITIYTSLTALKKDAKYTVQLKNTFKEAIGVLAAYWNEVASLNNLESVLFIRNILRKADLSYGLNVLEKYSGYLTNGKDLGNDVLSFLKDFYKVYGHDIICASLTENHVHQIKNFLPVVNEFLNVLKNYPLVTENYRSKVPEGSKRYYALYYPNGEYEGAYRVKYGKRGFRIHLDKDYKNVEFFTLRTVNKETDEKKKDIITTKPISEMKEGFEEVIKLFREEGKFSYLLSPPNEQFLQFLNKNSVLTNYDIYDYNVYKDTHLKLIEEAGNWEVIEEDFAFINKKITSLQELLNMYDEVNRFRIQVFACVGKQYKYYFVVYNQDKQDIVNNRFYMLTTKDLNDSELYKSKVTELLLKGI